MKKNVMTFIKQERTWEILFLGFLFCFYVGWAYLMPFDSCPDEGMRYQVTEYIYQNGTLPHGDDPAIRNATWGISYAFNPILSYMIGAVFMKITSIVTTDAGWLVLAARMSSVLSGVGMSYFVIKIGKKIFKGNARWLFIALVTLLPQSVYMFTYVNADSLALFSISIIVYMWIAGLESKWDGKYCVGLAIGISVCAMSYYNAYGFILCSIILFGVSLLVGYEKLWDYKSMLKKGILVSVIVLGLIAWWFIRNYIIYDGDFLGQKTSSMCAEMYAIDGLKPSQRHTPLKDGITVLEMLTQRYTLGYSWSYVTAISFIGCFGYLQLFVPSVITFPYLTILGIGFIGNFISFKNDFMNVKKNRMQVIFNWCMLAAMFIPVILSIYYSYASDYQPQGRYCLPMLLPLSYFVVKGLENIVLKISKKEKIWNIVAAVLAVIIFVVVLYVYKRVVRASYLATPLLDIGF